MFNSKLLLSLTGIMFIAAVSPAEPPEQSSDPVDPAKAEAQPSERNDSKVNLKLDFSHYPDSRILLSVLQDEQEVAEIPKVKPEGDNTGTDPRDFSSKFMPYYLHTELENNVDIDQLNMFAMIAFSPRVAMTMDMPVAKRIDYSGLGAFQNMTGGLPPGNGNGLPGGGVPFSDLESDGDVVGVGDLGLRFFYRPESLEWTYEDDNPMGKTKGISLMPLIEFTLPTATNDVIGGEALIVSPGFVVVVDLPGGPPIGLGFFAAMNFFDFDVFKDNSRGSTTRWRGRWFWMQPLSKPGPNLFDGIYVLTEFQPVYDFMESDFSFWIGPEFGKIVTDGFIIYAKPGWGIDTDVIDRDFTFEIGMRYFF